MMEILISEAQWCITYPYLHSLRTFISKMLPLFKRCVDCINFFFRFRLWLLITFAHQADCRYSWLIPMLFLYFEWLFIYRPSLKDRVDWFILYDFCFSLSFNFLKLRDILNSYFCFVGFSRAAQRSGSRTWDCFISSITLLCCVPLLTKFCRNKRFLCVKSKFFWNSSRFRR